MRSSEREICLQVTLGGNAHIELKKRLEEVRLLESRRSARLADQERDTDFARLADMAGDRRRASHSIDVPLGFAQQNNGATLGWGDDSHDPFAHIFNFVAQHQTPWGWGERLVHSFVCFRLAITDAHSQLESP
ncbi:hypothetical protein DMENIID0001_089560 [Sergentomyia squamirostris]